MANVSGGTLPPVMMQPYVRLKRLTEAELCSLIVSESNEPKGTLVDDVMTKSKRARYGHGVTGNGNVLLVDSKECMKDTSTAGVITDTLRQRQHKKNEITAGNDSERGCVQDDESVIHLTQDTHQTTSQSSCSEDRSLELYLTGGVSEANSAPSGTHLGRVSPVRDGLSQPEATKEHVDITSDDLNNSGLTSSATEQPSCSVDFKLIVIMPSGVVSGTSAKNITEETVDTPSTGVYIQSRCTGADTYVTSPSYTTSSIEEKPTIENKPMRKPVLGLKRIQLDHPAPTNTVVITDNSASKMVEYMRSIENLCNQPSPASKTKSKSKSVSGDTSDSSDTSKCPQPDKAARCDSGYSSDPGKSVKATDSGLPVTPATSTTKAEQESHKKLSSTGSKSRARRLKKSGNPPDSFNVFNVSCSNQRNSSDIVSESKVEAQSSSPPPTEPVIQSPIVDRPASVPKSISNVQSPGSQTPQPLPTVFVNVASPTCVVNSREVQEVNPSPKPPNSKQNFAQFHIKPKVLPMSAQNGLPNTRPTIRRGDDQNKSSAGTRSPGTSKATSQENNNILVTATTNTLVPLVDPVTVTGTVCTPARQFVNKQNSVTVTTVPQPVATNTTQASPRGKMYVRRGLDMQCVLRETSSCTTMPEKNKDNLYQCPECTRACVSVPGLDVHFRSAHDQSRMPHHCDMCGRGFFSYGTKVSHLFNEHRLRQVDEFVQLSTVDATKT